MPNGYIQSKKTVMSHRTKKHYKIHNISLVYLRINYSSGITFKKWVLDGALFSIFIYMEKVAFLQKYYEDSQKQTPLKHTQNFARHVCKGQLSGAVLKTDKLVNRSSNLAKLFSLKINFKNALVIIHPSLHPTAK